MTLIKSLLLGSAAGIVAVASAQAADLPTKKGAPAAQYVRICTITAGGTPITGFVLPGSDTCLKISGYVTAQIEGGNLKTAYAYNYGYAAGGAAFAPAVPGRDHEHLRSRRVRLHHSRQRHPRRGLEHGLRSAARPCRIAVQPR